MELTIEEMRNAAIVAMRDQLTVTRLIVTPTIGAIVTNPARTSFTRIEITDEQLIENKHRLARFVADRCDTAEIEITGHLSRA